MPTARTSLAMACVRPSRSNAYLKILRSADGSGYTARCPKCGIVKNFVVGSGGIDQRTFVLTCE
ncbi:MAG: hypothetical protein NTV94_02675 [Planctomycetota bacterium]|nr:hypothetical protein [Planctomycetota bacterium]